MIGLFWDCGGVVVGYITNHIDWDSTKPPKGEPPTTKNRESGWVGEMSMNAAWPPSVYAYYCKCSGVRQNTQAALPSIGVCNYVKNSLGISWKSI
jgi:hypothetical protein